MNEVVVTKSMKVVKLDIANKRTSEPITESTIVMDVWCGNSSSDVTKILRHADCILGAPSIIASRVVNITASALTPTITPLQPPREVVYREITCPAKAGAEDAGSVPLECKTPAPIIRKQSARNAVPI